MFRLSVILVGVVLATDFVSGIFFLRPPQSQPPPNAAEICAGVCGNGPKLGLGIQLHQKILCDICKTKVTVFPFLFPSTTSNKPSMPETPASNISTTSEASTMMNSSGSSDSTTSSISPGNSNATASATSSENPSTMTSAASSENPSSTASATSSENSSTMTSAASTESPSSTASAASPESPSSTASAASSESSSTTTST